jgi:hypothetical protein
LNSKAMSSAKLTTKLGLATILAALWMVAIPFAGAAAAGIGHQISAARAAAIHECSVLVNQYSEDDWELENLSVSSMYG